MMKMLVSMVTSTRIASLRVIRTLSAAGGALALLLLASAVMAQPTPEEGSAQVVDPLDTDGSLPPLQATATPERSDGPPALVGESVTVRIEIEVPAGWRATGFAGGTSPYVELVDATEDSTGGAEGRAWQTRWVVYRPGRFETRPRVLLVTDSGNLVVVDLDPFSIEVRSSIQNETNPQPAPNDPPLPVRIPDARPLWAAAATALVLIGVAIGWAWRRRELALRPLPPPPPPRPPHEVALERLERLAADGLLESGEHVLFHTELSEIVREFIGNLFRFPALESTTAEIRHELTRRHADVGDRAEAFVAILSDTDFVKFARYAPDAQFSRSCLAAAQALVEEFVPAADDSDAVPAPLSSADTPALPREEA
jgi:hypothetical protein